MPVLVTRADVEPGPSIVRQLLQRGGEVRAHCTGTGDVQRLRQQGAVTAVADADDVGHLESAMTRVHTVVHVGVDPAAAPSEDPVRAAHATMAAAAGAGVTRVILLSLAATRAVGSPIAALVEQVESIVTEAPIGAVILRTPIIVSPALADALTDTSGQGAQSLAAVTSPMEVAEVVAALDDERAATTAGTAVLQIDGGTLQPAGPFGQETVQRMPLLPDAVLQITNSRPDWIPEARAFLGLDAQPAR